jgi:hypothetical protein
MMRAHQPGSQPIDIPETIPNPAVPQPVRVPSPAPKPPVKIPTPQNVAQESVRSSYASSHCAMPRLTRASNSEQSPHDGP